MLPGGNACNSTSICQAVLRGAAPSILPKVKVKGHPLPSLSLRSPLQMLRARTCRACSPACSRTPRSPPPPAGTWAGVPGRLVWSPVAPAGSRRPRSLWRVKSGFRYKKYTRAGLYHRDSDGGKPKKKNEPPFVPFVTLKRRIKLKFTAFLEFLLMTDTRK